MVVPKIIVVNKKLYFNNRNDDRLTIFFTTLRDRANNIKIYNTSYWNKLEHEKQLLNSNTT